MSILEEKLNLKEKQKLENMFLGDKNRDASDKIRGFLFQDLVAINCLLEKETEYVCLEFLEDVNAFYKDSTLKFIQVKYYAKSNPNMNEIMTDLYYQFLRTEILKLDLMPKLQLIIYGKDKINIPDLAKMKTYVGTSKPARPKQRENPKEWLINEVYVLNKKEQKEKLFAEEANDESILCFLTHFKPETTKDIVNYREEVTDKLASEFPESDLTEDEENRKRILIGLAVGYVQKRYLLNNPNLDDLKVVKSEFMEDIRQAMETKTENHIVGYLTSIVGEQYISILENNPEVSEKDIRLLNCIASNTQIWISELASTKEGQYKLINTCSYKNEKIVKRFKELNVASRIIKIAECTINIEMFLQFLWKIMLDLCWNKNDFDLEKDMDMLKPQLYIDNCVENYICLKFEQDFVDTGVILPPVRAAKRNEDYTNICSRMYQQKPQKWYMSGHEYGKKQYSYNTANIKDDDSVIDTDDDSYFIECMDCIKIDGDKWTNVENCEKCIFARTCIGGKEY